MTRARDLLFRFRPAGAPGAASATGVPADRLADLTAELDPVFAQLTRTERECDDIVECAGREAAQVRARAAEQAHAVMAAAADLVDAERAAAAAEVRRRGENGSAGVAAAARREAEQLVSRARARMQDYVDSVVISVEGLISQGGDGTPQSNDGPAGKP